MSIFGLESQNSLLSLLPLLMSSQAGIPATPPTFPGSPQVDDVLAGKVGQTPTQAKDAATPKQSNSNLLGSILGIALPAVLGGIFGGGQGAGLGALLGSQGVLGSIQAKNTPTPTLPQKSAPTATSTPTTSTAEKPIRVTTPSATVEATTPEQAAKTATAIEKKGLSGRVGKDASVQLSGDSLLDQLRATRRKMLTAALNTDPAEYQRKRFQELLPLYRRIYGVPADADTTTKSGVFGGLAGQFEPFIEAALLSQPRNNPIWARVTGNALPGANAADIYFLFKQQLKQRRLQERERAQKALLGAYEASVKDTSSRFGPKAVLSILTKSGDLEKTFAQTAEARAKARLATAQAGKAETETSLLPEKREREVLLQTNNALKAFKSYVGLREVTADDQERFKKVIPDIERLFPVGSRIPENLPKAKSVIGVSGGRLSVGLVHNDPNDPNYGQTTVIKTPLLPSASTNVNINYRESVVNEAEREARKAALRELGIIEVNEHGRKVYKQIKQLPLTDIQKKSGRYKGQDTFPQLVPVTDQLEMEQKIKERTDALFPKYVREAEKKRKRTQGAALTPENIRKVGGAVQAMHDMGETDVSMLQDVLTPDEQQVFNWARQNPEDFLSLYNSFSTA